MKPYKIPLFLAGLFVVSAASASAQIANGGFESPPVPAGSFTQFAGGSNIGGAWTVLGSGVLLVNTTYAESFNGVAAFVAQSGIQSLDITGAGNTPPNNGVQQNIPTVAGQAYQISFFVGRADDGTNTSAQYNTPSTVDLSINGGARFSFTNGNITANTVNWQLFASTFTATGASTTITFLNGTPTVAGGGNNFAGLDNVSITTVPEPATALLLAMPLAGLWIISRKKQAG